MLDESLSDSIAKRSAIDRAIMKAPFLFLSLLTGCLLSIATTIVVAEPNEQVQKALVIYRIGEARVPVVLRDEYAVMLINDGDREQPSPRYIFARLSTRTVLDTKDLSQFRHVLSRLPKGSTVFEYDSCTVRRAWGLTEGQVSNFEESLSDLGLLLGEDRHITCYCEPEMARELER